MISNNIQIGNLKIGNEEPAFVIAKAGVNHNGDIELAKQLVLEAKRCNAKSTKIDGNRGKSMKISGNQ